MWVQFYDLLSAMMKEPVTKQLGEQLERYVKMDCKYPGYMRVHIEFPLEKPLLGQLMVKIKGRGQLPITLRYENVPHFCFTCGRIGHVAMNCQDPPSEEHDIRFGEELRASLPKRVKTISIHQGEVRVAHPLFQVSGLADKKMVGAGGSSQEHHTYSREMHAQVKDPGAMS
jgi:hypothetical protein